MKKLCKKIINPTNILMALFFIMFYAVNIGITSTDDIVYGNAFNSISTCINWINEFYHVWSGRITLTILINIFVNLPIQIFKIANSIMFIVVIVSGYKIINILLDNINKTLKNILLIILFCLIFYISVPVINSGCLWIAGSMNYLWPLAGMLVAIIPFVSLIKDKKVKNIHYVIFILANLLAGFAEQTGAILIAFGTIALIWGKIERKKIDKLLIIHYIIILIFVLINLLAPGNSVRSNAEELKWYPSFSMLSMSDKLVQGYINTADHIINDTTVLFSIIAVISSVLVISDKNIKNINKIIATIPIIYIILKVITANTVIYDELFNFQAFNINTLYSNTALLQLVSSSFILGIVAFQLIYALENRKNGVIAFILYCAGICSALTLSLSPTIYVSGNRVFTATDFLLVIINSLLLISLIKKMYNKKHMLLIACVLILIISFALFGYINLYTCGIYSIIW